ncbi:hypothetical protein AAZX31_09G093200 [Glycine max]|nr:hypothetical protein GLYMA_U043000v4 [Glycine max]|eukprot:XP_014628685.2 uncharacterized protein LOC106794114 isoform X1 [Glycine max]
MSANQRSTAPPLWEEFPTVLRMTHSLNDAQPVPATPASFCNPTNCNIGCDDVVQNQKNENETPPATQNSKPKRGRPFKTPPESIQYWYVIRKERKIANRFDTSYFHKETGFRCRSLKEIKNYEKYGSPPRRHKVKTQAKEESNDKTKNETEEMVVAQRKAKAEVMRTFVEEFLSKAYYNQLHMFDP